MPLLIVADVTKPGLRDATIRQISKYIAGAFAYAHVSGRYSAYSRRAAVTHDRGRYRMVLGIGRGQTKQTGSQVTRPLIG
jgi:hypothetical protein